MIKNKLKLNDSKTEFIVFRSPQAKQDFSSLSISVGDSIILQSSKVRDLGVIFDQSLSFDDYISLCDLIVPYANTCNLRSNNFDRKILLKNQQKLQLFT